MKTCPYIVTLISLLISILGPFPPELEAQIFVKPDAIGANDGTSWDNAYTSLQVALDSAEDGEQVWVSLGTYKPGGPKPELSQFIVRSQIELYGGFAGIESSLSERNWEINHTIIDGDLLGDDIPGRADTMRSDNAHHLFVINSPSGSVSVDGFHFRGGTTRFDYNTISPDSAFLLNGGGILLLSNASIRNSIFSENTGFNGAAISVNDEILFDTVIIEQCRFEDNSSISDGTLYLRNILYLEATNLSCTNNKALRGASISIVNSNFSISTCVFQENEAGFLGGAINVLNSTNSPFQNHNLTIRQSTFESNISESHGGAVFVNSTISGSSLNVEDCIFFNNSSGNTGGGISTFNNAPDTIKSEVPFGINVINCHFDSNGSSRGGGLYHRNFGNGGHVYVSASVFNNNIAYHVEGGGGIGIFQTPEEDKETQGSVIVDIESCSFKSNIARNGAGVKIECGGDTIICHIVDSDFLTNYSATSGAGAGLLSYAGGVASTIIRESVFHDNFSGSTSGALDFYSVLSWLTHKFLIESCVFDSNTAGEAGAVGIYSDLVQQRVSGKILNSTFTHNRSDTLGSSVLLWNSGYTTIDRCSFNEDSIADVIDGIVGVIELVEGSRARIENSLIGNAHNGAILNQDTIDIVNLTIVNCGAGLIQDRTGVTTIQNTIFMNNGVDFFERYPQSDIKIESKGGNISGDNTFEPFLTGYMEFPDLNNTTPDLDDMYVPFPGGNCHNSGNSEGVNAALDLLGQPRVMGGNIDIGCYELLKVTTKDFDQGPEYIAYPNPVGYHLFIHPKGNIKQVELYDMKGSLIRSFSDVKHSISTRSICSGAYFMKITDYQGRYYISKIIRQ